MLLSDLPGMGSPPPVRKRPSVPRKTPVEPVDPIVAPIPVAHERAFVEGWLEKKATWRFAWDHRYVLLDGDRLSYKVDEKKTEKGAGTVASLDCQQESLTFTVWLVEGGSWTLRAANNEQFNVWVEALLTALKMPTKSQEGSSAPLASAGAPPEAPQSSSPGADAPSDRWTSDALSGSMHGSVTASMMLSPVRTPGPAAWSTPQLVSKVMKKGAWTGVWKPRVVELYDGYQLEYKSNAEAAASRTRFTITTVDASFNINKDRQLFFTTTSGERFWVEFRSRAECSVWFRTIRESLRLNCAWRWIGYPAVVNAEGWSQWFSSSTRHAYAAVEGQYQATVIARHPTIRGSPSFIPKVLYVFGGSKTVCRPTFQPAARSCVPLPIPSDVMSEMRMLELGAANNAEAVDVQPFEERQHAKVRPRGVVGATLCAIADIESGATRLVLFGGSNGNVHEMSGFTSTDVWMTVVGAKPDESHRIQVTEVPRTSQDENSEDAEPAMEPLQWERVVFPTYELPRLAFHAAVSLDLLDAYAATEPASSIPSTTITTAVSHENLSVPRAGDAASPQQPSREEREAANDEVATPARTVPTPQPAFSSDIREAASDALTRPVLLFTGGLDASFRFRNEVCGLVWPSSVQVRRGASPQPRAVSLGFLPEPRAFHKTVVLGDGTVVLIGGRVLGESGNHTPSSAAAATPLRVYTVAKSAWQAAVESRLAEDVEVTGLGSADPAGSLPWEPVTWLGEPASQGFSADAVDDISVASRNDQVYVLCSRRSRSDPRKAEAEVDTVQLYRLKFLLSDPEHPHAPRQVRCEKLDIVAGTPPPRAVGASLHFLRNALYVVGASKRVDDEWSEVVRYTILPPFRIQTD